MRIRQLDETWTYDSEDEFSETIGNTTLTAVGAIFYYRRSLIFHTLEIESELRTDCVIRVSFKGDLDCRSAIERVFDVFETDAQKSKLPYEAILKPKIFIGHGGSTSWRDLKDHLHDKHSYEVVAYEVGSRAGHAIRDILEDMLAKSSFAILVMTAEDQTMDGQFRARQNVVHETGLFQAKAWI